MAYVIVALVLLLAVGAAFALGRRRTRRKVPRAIPCGLALAAAGIASIAAALAASDRTVEFAPATWLLVADAVAGLGVAALVVADTRAARTAAIAVALAWLALGLVTMPFALAVSACACVDVGPDYLAPTVAGADARGWLLAADLLAPILLLVAGLLLPNDSDPASATATNTATHDTSGRSGIDPHAG